MTEPHRLGRRDRVLIAAGALLSVAALVIFLRPRPDAPKPPPIPQERYIPPPPRQDELPPMPFSEVPEAESGLVFRHVTGGFVSGDAESRYLPECMGPGVVLFDFDGDRDADVFVPNGCAFPGRPEASPPPTSRLFRNEGGLRFRDVSESAGLAFTAYAMGGAAADVDGDGDADLLVTTWGGPRLFRNDADGEERRFVEVTGEAGLRTPGWEDAEGRRGPDWSTSAAFFDADRDGDLDLFVCNYVKWTPESDVFTSIDGKRKSFTIPDRYHGNSCRWFENEGGGRFRDRTRESGIFNEEGKSLGVAVWDFEGDGLPDLVVANDTQPNFLYRNRGGGKFEERALEAGIAYDENARTRAGMGIDAADYRNDGVPGVPIGNFSNEPTSLYRMEAPGFFRDVTQQEGVAAVTQVYLTFGLAFADADLDGFQDLVLANGHIEPRIQEVQGEISYAQPPQLLRNTGRGRFVDARKAAGPPFSAPIVARGLAVADLDGDGDLDLLFSANGGRLHLFRNDLAGPNQGLRVRLRGQAPNTEAIGAKILVRAGDTVQRRMVRTGSSYLSQSELVATFGLGTRERADVVEVTWPDGSKTTHEGAPAGSTLELVQR